MNPGSEALEGELLTLAPFASARELAEYLERTLPHAAPPQGSVWESLPHHDRVLGVLHVALIEARMAGVLPGMGQREELQS